ncbi:MAG: RNA polymerase sigma factor [Candidatus Limnocylindria bacterium]
MRRPPATESARLQAVGWVDERQAAQETILGLYDEHQRELFSFLLSLTRNSASAEDLLQEAFMRLIREVRSGRTPQAPRAWLFRVCTNLVVSESRHRRSAERWQARIAPATATASAEHEFITREDERLLSDALGDLATDARAGLLMSAHGFGGEEIAQLLGRSHLATRSLLFRARAKLRDRLRPGRADDD